MALDRGRRGTGAVARAAFSRIFGDEPWVGAEAARLEEMRTGVPGLPDHCAAGAGSGAASRWRTAAQLSAADPLSDRGCWLHVLALYRAGRTADALEAYTRHARTLDEELGLQPGAELRELQTAILRQAPELAAWPRHPEWTGAAEVATPTVAAAGRDGTPPSRRDGPLVGRQRELATVDRASRRRGRGSHPLAGAVGAAGDRQDPAGRGGGGSGRRGWRSGRVGQLSRRVGDAAVVADASAGAGARRRRRRGAGGAAARGSRHREIPCLRTCSAPARVGAGRAGRRRRRRAVGGFGVDELPGLHRRRAARPSRRHGADGPRRRAHPGVGAPAGHGRPRRAQPARRGARAVVARRRRRWPLRSPTRRSPRPRRPRSPSGPAATRSSCASTRGCRETSGRATRFPSR